MGVPPEGGWAGPRLQRWHAALRDPLPPEGCHPQVRPPWHLLSHVIGGVLNCTHEHNNVFFGFLLTIGLFFWSPKLLNLCSIVYNIVKKGVRQVCVRNVCSFVILRRRFCFVVRYVVSSGMLLSVGKVQEKEEGSTPPPSPPGSRQEEGGCICPPPPIRFPGTQFMILEFYPPNFVRCFNLISNSDFA